MEAIYIVAAIPVFFMMIGIEYLISFRQKKKYYRFADAVNSLSCGIFQQASNVFFGFWLIGVYTFLYEKYHVVQISMSSVSSWILCLLGVDFAYYLFHRVSHRVNFVWATHVVHHQSEEYNLSTALRQSALQGLFSVVFNWPLAFIGFPPIMTLITMTFVTLYQFWIHTRLIYKLGWFETVFNTPSHHRVHHGIDPHCIDKNYAGLFIIWDRLLGTFTKENNKPIHYGTVAPLLSWNPLWANIEGWIKIWKLSAACKNWKDKFYAWVAPPEWQPLEMGGTLKIAEVDDSKRSLYSTHESSKLQWYVFLQFWPAVGAAIILLLHQNSMPLQGRVGLLAWVALSLVCWGALFEKKTWAWFLEIFRMVVALTFLVWIGFFK